MRLVALNTEHFNHGNPYVAAGETWAVGRAQLAWLNATLANAEALLTRFANASRSGASAALYAEERRFFMSSTPLAYQPACDAWCQVRAVRRSLPDPSPSPQPSARLLS